MSRNENRNPAIDPAFARTVVPPTTEPEPDIVAAYAAGIAETDPRNIPSDDETAARDAVTAAVDAIRTAATKYSSFDAKSDRAIRAAFYEFADASKSVRAFNAVAKFRATRATS